MKGVLIVIDGMGDLPHDLLGGKTPLEAAHKPSLDFLSSKGELGYMYTVRQDFVPGSEDAILSLFGNEVTSVARGQMEAVGAGINTVRGDLALRTNFATIDSFDSRNIIDRRVGRTLTTKEAEILAKAVMKNVKLPVKFIFKPTIQHRGVLIFRGGFSDSISNVDTEHNSRKKNNNKISLCQSLDDEENSQYTADMINDFLFQSYKILNEHPINKYRKEKGLLPANFIITRGAGMERENIIKYPKWMACVYMPLEIGFGKLSNMEVYSFSYPKLKNSDVYANLRKGLKKACKYSIKSIKRAKRKDFDYVYIHIKEPDIPGHDGKPLEKKEMIEYIDKTLFSYLVKFVAKNNVKIVVTADHATPCVLKSHSSDPVPVLFYNNSGVESGEKNFSEKESKNGKLGKIIGKDFLKKIGFD